MQLFDLGLKIAIMQQRQINRELLVHHDFAVFIHGHVLQPVFIVDAAARSNLLPVIDVAARIVGVPHVAHRRWVVRWQRPTIGIVAIGQPRGRCGFNFSIRQNPT